MSDLLYRLNIDDGVPVWEDDPEKLDGIFAQALTTPGKRDGLCPFCGDGRAFLHADGVRRCKDCETTWILDSDYQRLTEDVETTANRLALEYQRAHSKPLFKMGG
jgi:hypothetical protein